jgi:hypothetical protein
VIDTIVICIVMLIYILNLLSWYDQGNQYGEKSAVAILIFSTLSIYFVSGYFVNILKVIVRFLLGGGFVKGSASSRVLMVAHISLIILIVLIGSIDSIFLHVFSYPLTILVGHFVTFAKLSETQSKGY